MSYPFLTKNMPIVFPNKKRKIENVLHRIYCFLLIIGLFGFSTGHIKIATSNSKTKRAKNIIVGQFFANSYKHNTIKKQREKTALHIKYVLA